MWSKASPPPPVRTVKGPDGKLRTEPLAPVPTPEQLAEAHRQTMDRITGNERFHEDPYTPAPDPGVDIHEYFGMLGELVTCPYCGIARFGDDWHCPSPPVNVCPLL